MTKYSSVHLRFKSLGLFKQNDIIKMVTSDQQKNLSLVNLKFLFFESNFAIKISYFINELILLDN